MSNWRPTSAADVARERSEIVRRLRDYFADTNTLEVDTPVLSPYAVSDTQIESLEARSTLSESPLYLSTSPEFMMKRLLAAGYPDIYSIGRVFRDGEIGSSHQPEFTMVEWYRLNATLDEIASDTVAAIGAALGSATLARSAMTLDYRDAFLGIANIDPMTATIDELAAAADADRDLRHALGDHRDDWLDLILSTVVTAEFAVDAITVVRHYPASQAALARLCPSDPRLADRFEVFIGPVEIANGYVELTDANEQRSRMQHDQDNRRQRGRRARPFDAQLLAALDSGLPQCSGVAMGLERLHMTHRQTTDIRDVITFAFETDHA